MKNQTLLKKTVFTCKKKKLVYSQIQKGKKMKSEKSSTYGT